MPTENSVRGENAEFTINREIIVASTMNSLMVAVCALIASTFRARITLQAEILALRHQLAVLQYNAPRRLRLKHSDRFLWVLLSQWWADWLPLSAHRSPGDGYRLAPQSVRVVLDAEITAACGETRTWRQKFVT